MFIDAIIILQSIKSYRIRHWLEDFNKGCPNKQYVKNIFKRSENLGIDEILAKSDYESVNPSFHIYMLNPNKMLTQAEFDAEFDLKTAKINEAICPVKFKTYLKKKKII